MKLPNGYGSVVKLGRGRRKPYVARVTVGWTNDGRQIKKYLGTFKSREEALYVPVKAMHARLTKF